MDRSPSLPRLPAPPRTRLSLPLRKRLERQQARRRALGQIRRPLSAEQRRTDPLAGRHRGPLPRLGRAAAAVLASAAVHAAVVLLGLLGPSETGRREVIRQEVQVEMREHTPPPPPPPPPAPPPPEKPVVTPPRVAKAPPPRTPPPEPAHSPPPRVVGLSLESTSEGGEGPAFAVGNTRAGATEERARAPQEVPSTPPTAPTESAPNQVASRIPTAGVSYALPRRRASRNPPYPETLKAQGIEADVPVMVTLDATGRVTKVKVLRPSPYPEFNEAARKAAAAEEFDPATRDGVPIPYTLSFTYRFRLEDQ
jgi:protein TonB